MSARTPELDPGQIRDYLLRRMPDSVRARFEEAYFRDDGLLDRIEAEEDVLVSDYVLGRLAETDRRRFEQSLLGMPYYQERVRTTSQLNLRVARLRFRPISRPAARSAAPPEADQLFPGRSGPAIAFAVLGVLLVAAVVTAMKLKSDLDRTPRPVPVPAAAPAPAAVVFEPDAVQGPRVKRLVRGGPLLVVVPRKLLPPATREWRLLVLGADGGVVWEAPAQKLTELPPGADLSVRLPVDVPPVGRSAFVVKAGGVFEDALVPLGVAEIVESPR
jgi:hypothetical protein